MTKAVEAQKNALTQLKSVSAMMPNTSFPPNMSLADMIPAQVKANIPQDVVEQLSAIKSVEDLNKKIDELTNAIAAMEVKIEESKKSQAEMSAAIAGITATVTKMEDMQSKMTVLKDAIPGAFEKAKDNYLQEIDNRKDALEKEFQDTLNEGFRNVYLTSGIASVFALFLLVFYSKKRENMIKSEN